MRVTSARSGFGQSLMWDRLRFVFLTRRYRKQMAACSTLDIGSAECLLGCLGLVEYTITFVCLACAV